VDEVLRIVGLEGVARRRAKGFSLGMGQRLGIASALLGDMELTPTERGVPGGRGDPMTDATIALTGPDHRAVFRASTFGESTSSCSSKTCTSASSTPPPASSFAT
jgi:hypothetical protein